MAKKILVVANTTWHIHNFRIPLLKKLISTDYEVIVAAPVDEYIHYLHNSCAAKHLPLRQLKSQSKNPFSDIKFTYELYQLFKSEKPDLIIGYTIKPNIYGNIAARILGIPMISVITGLGYTFIHPSFSNKIVRPLYRFALKKTLKVIFENHVDKKLFRELNLVNARKAVIIDGAGVNTNHFRPLTSPVKKNFIFLFMGRLLEDKGIHEFVTAAKNVKKIARNVECWVLGPIGSDNPAAISKEQLFKWVEDKYIRYMGTATDIRPFMKVADCFVLPSYREGMPRATLEALSMGKPVITTDTAGCNSTVIEAENGYIVPVGDTKLLTKRMLDMYYKNEDELYKMGTKSRQIALEIFDDRIIVKKYFKIINTFFKNRSKNLSIKKEIST